MRIPTAAGVEGIEPPVAVLETAGLPLTDTPFLINYIIIETINPALAGLILFSTLSFCFLMLGMLSARLAELACFNFTFNQLLVFTGIIINSLANFTFQLY